MSSADFLEEWLSSDEDIFLSPMFPGSDEEPYDPKRDKEECDPTDGGTRIVNEEAERESSTSPICHSIDDSIVPITPPRAPEQRQENAQPVEDDGPGTTVTTRGTGFRLKCTALLLTYKTHVEKKKLEAFIIQKSGHRTPKKIHIAHETGDTHCPYAHTHVVVQFAKPFETRDCRALDIDGIHPHIKRLTGKKAIDDAVSYIAKEDPDLAHLQRQMTLIDRIIEAPTALEAVRRCAEKPSDIGGVLQGFALKEVALKRPEPIDVSNRKWQKEMLAILERPAGARAVYWLFDEIGDTGKSSFSNFLEDGYQKEDGTHDWYAMSDVNDVKSAFHLILSAVQRGWNGTGVIIDLTRCFEFKSGIYQIIEQLKNGRITSTKYQGGRVCMKSPHVVIMSNWWPDTTKLS